MKKFLVIAFVSLFAVSAFAADVRFGGVYEIEGRYFENATQAEESDGSSAYYKHLMRLWIYAAVDPKLDVTGRLTMWDGPLDNSAALAADRGWATYKPFDGLKIEAGRYTGGNYDVAGFGGSWYEGTFEGSGGRSGIRATYALSDTVSLFAFTEKVVEVQSTNYSNGKLGDDNDAYMIGANIKMGDLGIFPRVGYSHLGKNTGVSQSLMSAYVGATYLPATGLNAKAVLAFVNATSGDNVDSDEYSVFGAMVDVSYVTDAFWVGAILAYASQDDYKAFSFGGNWDKTALIDDWFNDDDNLGVAGFTAIYLYGGYNVSDAVSLKALAAYYMATDDKIGSLTDEAYHLTLTEDTTAMEIDLIANYAWTEFTNLSIGAAYANMTEVHANKKDADPIYRLWWAAKTAF